MNPIKDDEMFKDKNMLAAKKVAEYVLSSNNTLKNDPVKDFVNNLHKAKGQSKINNPLHYAVEVMLDKENYKTNIKRAYDMTKAKYKNNNVALKALDNKFGGILDKPFFNGYDRTKRIKYNPDIAIKNKTKLENTLIETPMLEKTKPNSDFKGDLEGTTEKEKLKAIVGTIPSENISRVKQTNINTIEDTTSAAKKVAEYILNPKNNIEDDPIKDFVNNLYAFRTNQNTFNEIQYAIEVMLHKDKFTDEIQKAYILTYGKYANNEEALKQLDNYFGSIINHPDKVSHKSFRTRLRKLPEKLKHSWKSCKKSVAIVFILLAFTIYLGGKKIEHYYEDKALLTIPPDGKITMLVKLNSVDFDHSSHVGNDWEYNFLVNENRLQQGKSIKLDVNINDELSISARAKENDSVPDVGYSSTVVDIDKMNFTKRDIYALKVLVKENRGRYTDNTATNVFNYSVERYVSPADVLHAIMN